LILTALIAVGSIAVLQVLGTNLQRKLGTVSESIRGGSSHRIEGRAITEREYQIRDLGDFEKGIRDNDDDE
jgi:hypothetical protein